MKRILILITLAVMLAGILLPAGTFADGEHPITLEITCDPMPELEGEGTIPDLLFTIRNNSKEDYTLKNAKLSGGFENREMILDETITVLAGATKEFHLNDVPVREDQLDRDITYRLKWEEPETVIDPETGEATFLTHRRDASASILIERFVVPELTVSASCKDPYVRRDETFTVVYTIRNDTEFDISALKLYDPEQSMQSIPLESSELSAGKSISVSVEYRMGMLDMTFEPRVEYLARRRETVTRAEKKLTVESIVVDLMLSTEVRPVTSDGTTFAVTIRNNGNRDVKKIRVYDEINTLLEKEFSLGPDEFKTLIYTVHPAVSSERTRSVRFHLTAVDFFEEPIRLEDPNAYEVVPYVAPDSVRLGLSVVLQSPYYDENGKLCASLQFSIRNNGDVKIYNAVLSELTLFGTVISYPELRHGDTYYTQTYQLDGITELKFRVDAIDPAGETCSSETISLDLSTLKERADSKNNSVIVHTTNPYLQDLGERYSGVLRVVALVGLIVALACAIFCVALYIVEVRIRNKLPGEFEEDIERAMKSTKRRTEKQLFSDAPTEQFGYTAPIKLRNYGDLTEEEAKARRELYEKGLKESLRREKNALPDTSQSPNAAEKPNPPVSDSTRAINVQRTGRIPTQTPNASASQRQNTQPIQTASQRQNTQPISQATQRTDGFRSVPKTVFAPIPPLAPKPDADAHSSAPEKEAVPENVILSAPDLDPEPEIAFAPEAQPDEPPILTIPSEPEYKKTFEAEIAFAPEIEEHPEPEIAFTPETLPDEQPAFDVALEPEVKFWGFDEPVA